MIIQQRDRPVIDRRYGFVQGHMILLHQLQGGTADLFLDGVKRHIS